jgi:hypothetical protein
MVFLIPMAGPATPPVAPSEGHVSPPPTAPRDGGVPTPPTVNSGVTVAAPATVVPDGGTPAQPPVGSVEISDTGETGYQLSAGSGISLAKVGSAIQITGGGGGSTPAPPDGSLQFDNAGALGAFGKYDPVQASTSLDVTSTATGTKSFASGELCVASGDWSTSIGFHCQATQQAAVCMGFGCFSLGQASVCIGFSSFAELAVAVAVGDGLDSAGIGSCTLTEDNHAFSDHSYAFGEASESMLYGEYCYAGQGINAPRSNRQLYLFGHAAGVAVNLTLGDTNEIVLENGFSYGVTVDLLGVSQTGSSRGRAVYEGLVHVVGGTVTIDDMTLTYTKNTPGYTFTFNVFVNPDRRFQIHCTPAGDTVNFIALVTLKALAGIA